MLILPEVQTVKPEKLPKSDAPPPLPTRFFSSLLKIRSLNG